MKYVQHNVEGRVYEVYEHYSPMRLIGSGAYGEVSSFKDNRTGEQVAIKKILGAFQNTTTASRTLREVMILRRTCHENIVRLHDLIVPESANPALFNNVYMVYELMDTDLHRVISAAAASGGGLEDTYCKFFIYQILRGLKYLHSGNILHRDLKPSNVLINCDDCLLKICDFGLARTSSEDEFLTEYVVTRPYRPPELLLGSRKYTAAVDIWSAGCILVEMMTGQPLFPVRSWQEHPVMHLQLIAEILGSPADESDLAFLPAERTRQQVFGFLDGHPRVPLSVKFAESSANTSPLAWDLAQKMLQFDPSRRISASQALDHPYLDALHDVSDEPTCPTLFNFDCYHPSLTMDHIRKIIWKEALALHASSDSDHSSQSC